MIWIPPKMWEGGECWIIGGGPSMPRQFGISEDVIEDVLHKRTPPSTYSPYLSPIHDKHVIGVNAAFLIGDWMDMVFFGDGKFYFQNQEAMNAYPKLRVTCNPNLHKRPHIKEIKFMARDGNHAVGLTTKKGHISWNHNSGAAAMNVAVHMGAKRIFLLGFDMTTDDKKNLHWHSEYSTIGHTRTRKEKSLPYHKHTPSFPFIARDAAAQGIEIINVSLESTLKQFPKMNLEEALKL